MDSRPSVDGACYLLYFFRRQKQGVVIEFHGQRGLMNQQELVAESGDPRMCLHHDTTTLITSTQGNYNRTFSCIPICRLSC